MVGSCPITELPKASCGINPVEGGGASKAQPARQSVKNVTPIRRVFMSFTNPCRDLAIFKEDVSKIDAFRNRASVKTLIYDRRHRENATAPSRATPYDHDFRTIIYISRDFSFVTNSNQLLRDTTWSFVKPHRRCFKSLARPTACLHAYGRPLYSGKSWEFTRNAARHAGVSPTAA
jgi:hypothetical protein